MSPTTSTLTHFERFDAEPQPPTDNELVAQYQAATASAAEATDPDAALAARRQADDAWAQLYTRHYPKVLAQHMKNVSGDKYSAEDLAQNTMLRAFQALDRFTPGTVGGWLWRIGSNLQIDRGRHLSSFPELPLDDCDYLLSVASKEEVDKEIIDNDACKALLELVPKVFRSAVYLVDVQGKSYDQAAAELGKQIGTVRSRLNRGREALRQALVERAQENPDTDQYLGFVAACHALGKSDEATN